jgi:hypothetical protein
MRQRWRDFQYGAAGPCSPTRSAYGHADGNVYVNGDADGYGSGLDEDAAANADFFDADCEVTAGAADAVCSAGNQPLAPTRASRRRPLHSA